MSARCDSCRRVIEHGRDLEVVVRHCCRDCAAAHDLDVPLCKAHTLSLIAELHTRKQYAVYGAKAFAVLEAARDFGFKRYPAKPDAPHGIIWRRADLDRLCTAIEAWREEMATLDTEKVAVPEMVVHLEREK